MKLSKTGKKAIAIVTGGVAMLIILLVGGRAIIQREVDKLMAERTSATGETADTEIATKETAANVAGSYKEAYNSLNIDENGAYRDFDVQSAVTLPADYKNLTIPSNYTDEISDEVQNNLEYIRTQYGELKDPENGRKTVERGDVISFSYSATVDGEMFYLSDGSESKGAISGYIVGNETLFDDLDDRLLNQEANKEFKTTVTVSSGSFSSDNNEAVVVGKEADITITILSIKVPVLTNKVIESCFTGYVDEDGNAITTIDEAAAYFDERVKDSVKADYVQYYMLNNSTIDENAMDAAISKEKDFLTNYYQIKAEDEGYENLDDYSKVQGFDTFEAMWESSIDETTDYVKTDLIYQAVAKDLGIKATQADVVKIFDSDIDTVESTYTLPYAYHEALSSLAKEKIVANADFKQ